MKTRLRFALARLVYVPYAALRGLYVWLMRPYLLVWDMDARGRLREHLTEPEKVAYDEWKAGDAQRPFGEGAGS